MKVGVLVVPGCWDSGLTTVLDVLRAANASRPRAERMMPEITARTVAQDRTPVPTAGGLLAPVDLALDDEETRALDVLVVPALGPNGPSSVVDALMRPGTQALRAGLRAWSTEGGELAAACTGTFLLAEAGLLDRRRATTSWWLADTVVSALLADGRPAPSVESAVGYLSCADQLVIDFEAWVRANLASDSSVGAAALALGTTRRTLERRVRRSLGITPYALVQRLRAEHAHHLQRTTALSLERIAPMVGFRSAATVRAMLRTRCT